MKNILLLTAFLFVVCSVYSQEKLFSLGVKAGINLSNLSIEGPDMDARLGYQFGVVGEYKLQNSFFLHGSLNISSKGAKYKVEEYGDINGDGYGYEDYISMKTTWNATYLELPVMVGYKLSVTNDLAIKFMAGPYIACGIGGKISAKGYTDIQNKNGGYTRYDESGKVDTFSDESLKRFDAGLSGAVAFEYSRFIFTLGYQYGIADISQGANSIHNQNAFATVGYTFF